jgi:hypothetical protein
MHTRRRGLAVVLQVLSVVGILTWSGLFGFVMVAYRVRWGDIKPAEVVPVLLPLAFWLLTAWSCRAAVSRSSFWWSGVGAQASLVGLCIDAMRADPLSAVVFLYCLPLSLGWILLAAERTLQMSPWRSQSAAARSLTRSPIKRADDERP